MGHFTDLGFKAGQIRQIGKYPVLGYFPDRPSDISLLIRRILKKPDFTDDFLHMSLGSETEIPKLAGSVRRSKLRSSTIMAGNVQTVPESNGTQNGRIVATARTRLTCR